MSDNRKDLPNIIIENLVNLTKERYKQIDRLNQGQPLGMKPKSTKEQLEWFYKLTPKDELAFAQLHGEDKYREMMFDMEKLAEKSEQGFRSYYGIEKEINDGLE